MTRSPKTATCDPSSAIRAPVAATCDRSWAICTSLAASSAWCSSAWVASTLRSSVLTARCRPSAARNSWTDKAASSRGGSDMADMIVTRQPKINSVNSRHPVVGHRDRVHPR